MLARRFHAGPLSFFLRGGHGVQCSTAVTPTLDKAEIPRLIVCPQCNRRQLSTTPAPIRTRNGRMFRNSIWAHRRRGGDRFEKGHQMKRLILSVVAAVARCKATCGLIAVKADLAIDRSATAAGPLRTQCRKRRTSFIHAGSRHFRVASTSPWTRSGCGRTKYQIDRPATTAMTTPTITRLGSKVDTRFRRAAMTRP